MAIRITGIIPVSMVKGTLNRVISPTVHMMLNATTSNGRKTPAALRKPIKRTPIINMSISGFKYFMFSSMIRVIECIKKGMPP